MENYAWRMRFRVCALAIVGSLLVATSTLAVAGERSRSVRAEFVRANPCSATGRAAGGCPGWVVDHVVPRACGGVDYKDNMAWQTKADAAAKDRVERQGCHKPPGMRGIWKGVAGDTVRVYSIARVPAMHTSFRKVYRPSSIQAPLWVRRDAAGTGQGTACKVCRRRRTRGRRQSPEGRVVQLRSAGANASVRNRAVRRHV